MNSKQERFDFQGLDFVHKVGLELEAFSPEGTFRPNVPGAIWENDAGIDLCELISMPHKNYHEAYKPLYNMLSKVDDIHLTAQRPMCLSHNQGKWQDKQRYKALRAGVKTESPQHHQKIDVMTDWAALQDNVSGSFDPFGEEGVFLINMFNHIAPFHASRLHSEICIGKGHLAIWRKFARKERFPVYHRWFPNSQSLRVYIENIPKLFVKNRQGIFETPKTEKHQSIACPTDLGVMWWFARPKRNEENETYLELRYKPSMPIREAEKSTGISIRILELLLFWYHNQNNSKPVLSIREAEPALAFLSQLIPEYVPKKPLSWREWNQALRL